MTADFSADCIETLQAKSQWNNILKAIKEKKNKTCSPRILYPVKISLKIKRWRFKREGT